MIKKVTKRRRCAFCRESFTWSGKGRRPLYCSRSHRQRAFEVRRKKRLTSNPLMLLQTDLAENRIANRVFDMVFDRVFDMVMKKLPEHFELIPRTPPKPPPTLKLVKKED